MIESNINQNAYIIRINRPKVNAKKVPIHGSKQIF